jgi:hypothetical protein
MPPPAGRLRLVDERVYELDDLEQFVCGQKRGSLRGKTVPDGADSGLSLLACASVLTWLRDIPGLREPRGVTW